MSVFLTETPLLSFEIGKFCFLSCNRKQFMDTSSDNLVNCQLCSMALEVKVFSSIFFCQELTLGKK